MGFIPPQGIDGGPQEFDINDRGKHFRKSLTSHGCTFWIAFDKSSPRVHTEAKLRAGIAQFVKLKPKFFRVADCIIKLNT